MALRKQLLSIFAAAILIFASALILPAIAQERHDILVVNACGTLPVGTTYAPGQVAAISQDVTGSRCNGGIGYRALIVSVCGTLPAGTTYAQGQVRAITQDQTGKAC